MVKEGDKASFLSSFFGSPAVRPKPPSYSTASQRRCRNGKEGAKMEKKKGKKREKVFFRPFSSSSGMMHRSGTTSPSPPLFSILALSHPPRICLPEKELETVMGQEKFVSLPSGPSCMYGTSGGGPIKEFRLGALGGRRRGVNESSRPAIPRCWGRNRTLLWEGSGPPRLSV